MVKAKMIRAPLVFCAVYLLGVVTFHTLANALEDQEQYADFSVSANPVRPGDVVTFDASRSDFPGQPVSFEWDFGDGESGSGVVVTHAYADTGDYITVLEALDDLGNSDTRQIKVMVLDSLTFIRLEEYITMRDGVKISVALDLPRQNPPPEGWPVIISGHGGCGSPTFMNPEDYRGTGILTGIDNIEKGYSILRLITRGCQDCGGDVLYGGRLEALDVREIITHLIEKAPVNQERLGYMGGSHGGLLGFNLLVGEERLRALIPMNATTNVWEGLASDGSTKYEFLRRQAGNLLENSGESLNWRWAISLLSGVNREQTSQEMRRWISTDWLLDRLEDHPDTVAVFLKLNWTDMQVRANEVLSAFQEIKEMGIPVWLYAGYGGHNNWTTGGFGGDALLQRKMRTRFFDHNLMDVGPDIPEDSTVVYLIYGTRNLKEGTFRYGTSPTWPPEGSQSFTIYLREAGALSPTPPGGSEAPDTVSNVVEEELPESVNWASWVLEHFDELPEDGLIRYTNRLLTDVGAFSDSIPLCRVCYTSPALIDSFEMTGIPHVAYTVRPTGEQFQIFTEVLDVSPGAGEEDVLITMGPFVSSEHIPDQNFSLSHDLYAMSYLFRPGHKIKVCLSNKSREEVLDWGKGLGIEDGETWGDGPYIQATFTDGETLILHDSEYPSWIILPVVGDLPSFEE
ncbi:MAG: PKD domain-containing protein [Candidatus Glassbacteria bacterium]